jgi:phage terminase large subunit GpA-like protein
MIRSAITTQALATVHRELAQRYLVIPERLTAHAWAERYRELPADTSARPGPWRSYPWQCEPLELASRPDRDIERLVLVWPAQVAGKTECILCLIGWAIDQDPSPMLIVEPTLEMARDLSKDRLDPLLATPRLRPLVRQASGRREPDVTILKKAGPGWRLALVGANSPSGLAMRPIRRLFLDEIDRYPASAGVEGDPVRLAEQRTVTFADRLIVITGTPTERERGIWLEWEASDQRLWMVPCPHCGYRQSLEWGHPATPGGLRWERDAAGLVRPETAAYECAGCRQLIPETARDAMVSQGQWVPQAPGRPIAGFRLTALVSPRVSWAELVRAYHQALEYPEQLRVWMNTVLAVPYDPPSQQVTVETLARVRLDHDPEGYPMVPVAAQLLTAGVDVQGDRLECLIAAWGPGEECWWLGVWRLAGDPMSPEPWELLEALRSRRWLVAGGERRLTIRRLAVDAGAYQRAVLGYTSQHPHVAIPTKGSSELTAPLLTPPALRGRRRPMGQAPWILGTIALKDVLFGRLQKPRPGGGPGAIHLGEDLDEAFVEQLGAERRVIIRRGTQRYARYEVIGRRPNEAIDLAVLALAAYYSLGPATVRQLRHRTAAGSTETASDEASPAPIILPAKPKALPRRTNWITSW